MHPMTKMSGLSAEDVFVPYLISSVASRFTVQAFAGGLLAALGHNPVIAIQDFSGEIRLHEEIAKSSVGISISAASLMVTTEMSAKDRTEIDRIMHEQVLESERYPEIKYDCDRISASKTEDGQYWVALNGELTMHGTTRSLPISARALVSGETLKAFGTFSILQSDYGIAPVSVGAGTLKVKDELKFSFDIVGKRQE